VAKRYGATQALRSATLGLHQGEVLGLVGENGSGKSTLLRLMGGIERPDAGEILRDGQPMPARGLSHSVRRGVALVFQELALVGNLKVFESFFLLAPSLAYRLGVRRGRWARERCRGACLEHGLDVDPDRLVAELPFGQRQLLEVIRALELPRMLGHANPVVLLDEPTTALDHHEIEQLMSLVDQARRASPDSGAASFVFVGHRLTELLEISDRVVVMRDGHTVAERQVSEVSEGELHTLMVGRERARAHLPRSRHVDRSGAGSLELSALSGAGFTEVSLTVHPGEIVGLAGVQGSGRSELCEAVHGLRPLTAGHVRVLDKATSRPRPNRQVARGLAYLPRERSAGGILESASVARHVGLQMMRGRLLSDKSAERAAAEVMIDRFAIAPADPDVLVGRLSGGNQQKVALGRWMIGESPAVYVLDNPTRGVDVGAREVIYHQIRAAAGDGACVLMASDELDELLGLCDTIHVMRDGRIAHTLDVTASELDPTAAQRELVAQMV
jgi:ribose transport system ATP-binding protein